MPEKPTKKVIPLRDLKLSGDWNSHIDTVRPGIEKLDRRQAESVTRAPFIVVTNATK